MLRVSVPTMTCGGCAKAVTRIVQAAAGSDAPVEINLAAREIRIGAAAAAESTIREALAKGGYLAEPREAAAIG